MDDQFGTLLHSALDWKSQQDSPVQQVIQHADLLHCPFCECVQVLCVNIQSHGGSNLPEGDDSPHAPWPPEGACCTRKICGQQAYPSWSIDEISQHSGA